MTHADNPRLLWGPPLLTLGVRPWDMWRFTPGELNQISDWAEEQARGKKA